MKPAKNLDRHRSPTMNPLEQHTTKKNSSTSLGRFVVIGSPGKDRDRLVLRLETLGYV
jgi:hypothetical protein